MAELTPPNRNVSLDDLLEANKARFDRIFETQMGESARLDRDRLPSSNGDLDAVPDTSGRPDGGDRAAASSGSESPARAPTARYAEDGHSASAPARPGSAAPARRPAGSTAAAPRPVARTESRAAAPATSLDPVTLDLIENALRNARHEMDAVLFRSAMSPVIREQHDEFPMITDPQGRMIVGQFGSYVSEMLAEQAFELEPGDIILQSDPYKCGGAISHINDWMVLIPIFFEGRAGRLQLDVRPHDGCRRAGARQHADRGDLDLRRGDPNPADQDLLARQAEPGGPRHPDEQHPHPGDETTATSWPSSPAAGPGRSGSSRSASASAPRPTAAPARRCSIAPCAPCATSS